MAEKDKQPDKPVEPKLNRLVESTDKAGKVNVTPPKDQPEQPKRGRHAKRIVVAALVTLGMLLGFAVPAQAGYWYIHDGVMGWSNGGSLTAYPSYYAGPDYLSYCWVDEKNTSATNGVSVKIEVRKGDGSGAHIAWVQYDWDLVYPGATNHYDTHWIGGLPDSWKPYIRTSWWDGVFSGYEDSSPYNPAEDIRPRSAC
jgi:hypothetical protein